MVLQIDEKIITLTNSFIKAKRIHSDQLEKDVAELNGSILEIKEAIQEEKAQREEGSEHIVAKVEHELEKLEEDILIEQKVREETSDKLKTLISEMEAKLERDIDVTSANPRTKRKKESTPTPPFLLSSKKRAQGSSGHSTPTSNN